MATHISMIGLGPIGADSFALDFEFNIAGGLEQSLFTPVMKAGLWNLTVTTSDFSPPGPGVDDSAWFDWWAPAWDGDLFYFPCGPADGPFIPVFFPSILAGPDPDCSITIQPQTTGGSDCDCPDSLWVRRIRMARVSSLWAIKAHLSAVWISP